MRTWSERAAKVHGGMPAMDGRTETNEPHGDEKGIVQNKR